MYENQIINFLNAQHARISKTQLSHVGMPTEHSKSFIHALIIIRHIKFELSFVPTYDGRDDMLDIDVKANMTYGAEKNEPESVLMIHFVQTPEQLEHALGQVEGFIDSTLVTMRPGDKTYALDYVDAILDKVKTTHPDATLETVTEPSGPVYKFTANDKSFVLENQTTYDGVQRLDIEQLGTEKCEFTETTREENESKDTTILEITDFIDRFAK